MLQPDQAKLANRSFGGYHTPSQEEPGLTELFRLVAAFVRRQYLIILFVGLLATGAGLLYLHFAIPTYKAYAQIVTDSKKGQFFQNQSVLAAASMDSAEIESQIQILKSESIASSVINDLHLTESPEFSGSGPKPRSKTELMRDVVAIFDSKLDAKRVGVSYVIEIGFQSQSPQRAAQIANAIADRYILEQQEAQIRTNQLVGNWLQTRLTGLREQVSDADRAVIEFASKHNIVSSGGRLIDDQQLSQLNTQLVGARSRTSEALARLFRIQAVNLKGRLNEPTDATVSDALRDPIITSLRQKQLEIANRLTDWTTRYGPNHDAVARLRTQQREIQQSIHKELERLAESYKSDYAIARTHEEEIQKGLANAVGKLHLTNTEEVKFRELKSAAQSYHNLYDSFLKQYTTMVQQRSFPIPESRVISRASPPLSKSSPKGRLILTISMLGGLCLGIGFGILRELMDRVFRTRDQVETLLLTPCAAMIPLLNNKASQKLLTNRKPTSAQHGPKSIIRGSGAYWTLVDSPESRFAEAIRSVKLAMDAATDDHVARQNKIIGFTSSIPNEGKSTIAAAVAQLSAQVGEKVLVVDCDLRNPSLSRAFTKNSAPGLVEAIAGRRSIDDVIWREPTTNFAFLPAGNNYQLSHTSEILASDLTKKLFDNLRQRYDYVIVDLPPLAPIVDTRATIRFVDTYFIVIEWGETKIEVVKHALNGAPTIYENLSGVILNKTNMKSLRRYELDRKEYYYNKYYRRYGYTQ